MRNLFLQRSFLDRFDRDDLWSSTALIVCTDHGHYLGERDIFGKPGVPHYEPIGHTPLMIAWPGEAPRSISGSVPPGLEVISAPISASGME